MINKINEVLSDQRNSEEFHKKYEYWLDELSVKRYRKYVKDFYK